MKYKLQYCRKRSLNITINTTTVEETTLRCTVRSRRIVVRRYSKVIRAILRFRETGVAAVYDSAYLHAATEVKFLFLAEG